MRTRGACYNRAMMKLLLVFVGGGLGALLRYFGGVTYVRLAGPATPWMATGMINVLGGLVMGLLVSTLAFRGGAGQENWRLFVGFGVLGGFTTFSTFSLEAVMMLQRRDYTTLSLYVLGSVVLSMLALMAGLELAKRVLA